MPTPFLASLWVAVSVPTVPTGLARRADRSADWMVTVGSLKSLTIVVTKRSPSPENRARLPPLSIATDVTPVMVVAEPPTGVNVTPVQFMNLLVADMICTSIKRWVGPGGR